MALLPLSTWASNWSGNVQVTELIGGYKGGFFLFKTTGTHHNPNGSCETSYYSVDPESADADKAYALVLAALKSGSDIKVGVDPTGCGRSGVQHLTNKIKVTRVSSN